MAGFMDVPFVFLVNAGSGSGDSNDVLATIERLIPRERLGGLYLLEPGDDFRRILNEAVEECRLKNGALIIAGGDGTVNAAITHALPAGVRVGVIPQGTFNYFARQHGIPLDLDEAVRSLLTARFEKLPVCFINGNPFIVNASLGLHAKIIAARERHTRVTGRNRLVAVLSGLYTLLKEHYSMRARLTLDGRQLQCKATMVLVSNNHLQLEALKLPDEDHEVGDQLAVVVMHELSRRALFSLIWKRLLGQMDQARDLERFWARHVRIQLARPFVRVVVDGELKHLRTPLMIHVQPDALTCLLPGIGEEDQ